MRRPYLVPSDAPYLQLAAFAKSGRFQRCLPGPGLGPACRFQPNIYALKMLGDDGVQPLARFGLFRHIIGDERHVRRFGIPARLVLHGGNLCRRHTEVHDEPNQRYPSCRRISIFSCDIAAIDHGMPPTP